MSAQLRIERMKKNNQNFSNVSEEVHSLTNDCNIQSKLHKVQEKLLSVKLYSNSSSSEESPSGTDEEATNKEQEEVSKEEIKKSGDAFCDWFNWNKNQRKKASLAAENNQTEPEGFKCLNSTEESFLESCQTPSKKVFNNHENTRTPLQQHDTQEKLNNTKTPSESNSVNKSKTSEGTPLQRDDKQEKLNNTKTPSESNSVNKSKTSEGTPLQRDDKQEKLNNKKSPCESNNVINKSKPTERTPLQQDVIREKLCNSRTHSQLNRVNTSKAQQQSNKGDLPKTPYRKPLQPNDLRLKLNKSKAQHKSNDLDTMISPDMTPIQQRLLHSQLRTNPSNSQQQDGRVQAERKLPEKQVYTNAKVKMLAEDSTKGMSGSPTRLLDVLAEHNQENSEVIANILAERQLPEKLLTERVISSGEKAISEETSTRNRRQVKTSEKYSTSSCLAQDRLAKLRSNR